MLHKIFVGNATTGFQKNNLESPVDGIRLIKSEGVNFESGNMDGKVWEYENPYATKEMADQILADLQGYTYLGYEASNVVIDPLSELGDGVTISGSYSMLAYKKTTFSPNNVADIAAPGTNEPDDEYPYKSQADRKLETDRKKIYSEIKKTNEELSIEFGKQIEGATETLRGEIKVSADNVTAEFQKADSALNETLTGKISASASELTAAFEKADGNIRSEFKMTADKVAWAVSGTSDTTFTMTQSALSAISKLITLKTEGSSIVLTGPDGKNKGNIDMKGYVTFTSLETRGATTINGDNITTGTIKGDLIDTNNLTVGNFFSVNSRGKVTINGNVIDTTNLTTAVQNNISKGVAAGDDVTKVVSGTYDSGSFIDERTLIAASLLNQTGNALLQIDGSGVGFGLYRKDYPQNQYENWKTMLQFTYATNSGGAVTGNAMMMRPFGMNCLGFADEANGLLTRGYGQWDFSDAKTFVLPSNADVTAKWG